LSWTDRTQKISDGLGYLLRLKTVKDPVGDPSLRDQVGTLEDGKVTGYGWSGYWEPGCDIAGRELRTLEFLEDLPSSRIRECAKRPGNKFHMLLFSYFAKYCQGKKQAQAKKQGWLLAG
jgi:hypothetical protein